MKTAFNISSVAMAVATIVASGAVCAQNGNSNTTTNVTDVEMVKILSLSKALTIEGNIAVRGNVVSDSSSLAVIDDKQSATENTGENYLLQNTATAGDEVMSGATGNIGLNMVSGDNNLQDNASAITVINDEGLSAGLIDSEVFVRQTTESNHTSNQGVENLSSIGNSAFVNASGNIGVNVATGNNNLQKNNLAVSVGNGAIAEASVNTEQNVHNNFTNNIPLTVGTPGEPGEPSGQVVMKDVTFTATGPGAPTETGDITGGRLTNTVDGSYTGTEAGEFHGSLSGNYTGNHSGDIAYGTISNVDLGGELTGQVPVWVLESCGGACAEEDVVTKNVATLGGQAFMGATGNIGINVSAGTNNVQSNSLSMAVIPAPTPAPTLSSVTTLTPAP